MLGLFRTKLLTKTRLWRGFVVRLPEGSQEPTRQLVAVLVDSEMHCANSVLARSDPKMEDLEIVQFSHSGENLWSLRLVDFKWRLRI